jgi:hypothetical protein
MRAIVIVCATLMVGFLIDWNLYDGSHSQQAVRLVQKTFNLKTH